jgi:hypothetical protein
MFDAVMDASEIVVASQETVVWERCFRQEVCVRIPFVGRRCVRAEACVRIIASGQRFFLELQVFGRKIRYGLANACFPAFTVGIARLEVCARVRGSTSVCLVIRLCIGARLGPINLQRCWQLFNGCVNFARLDAMTEAGMTDLGMSDPVMVQDAVNSEAEYVYVETGETEPVLIPEDFDMQAAIAKHGG